MLYLVDIETGVLTKKISTGVGLAQDPNLPGTSHPNGLSTPVVADPDGDGVGDYAYAGDLYGNMWKFDLRAASSSGWVVANSGEPLFKARNALGKAQPITEKPQVDIGPRGLGLIVLFGTGKFFEASDRDVANGTVQSFYGIYDANTGSDVVSRTELVQQKIIGQTSITNNGIAASARATSDEPVPKGKKGWYLDLVPPSPGVFEGEMQVTDPVLRNGRVLFTTLIPDPDPCAYGGRSWLMALDEMTGGRLGYSPFDFNNDRSFNSSDFITVDVAGTPTLVPASGVSRNAIMSRPALIAGKDVDYAITTDTAGGGLGDAAGDDEDEDEDHDKPPPDKLNPGPGVYGRQSWRQLR